VLFIVLPLARAPFPKYFTMPEHPSRAEHCAGCASDPQCFPNSAVGVQ